MGDSDVLSHAFALVIAQILPGLLVICGLAFHVPVIQAWLGVMASQPVTVGGALFVVLLATFASMVLNGGRFVLFEKLLRIDRRPRRSVLLRTDPAVEAVYRDITYQHYAYYQFYGSAVVAWPIFIALAVTTKTMTTWPIVAVILGAGAVEAILVACAYNAMNRFLNKRDDILPSRVLEAV